MMAGRSIEWKAKSYVQLPGATFKYTAAEAGAMMTGRPIEDWDAEQRAIFEEVYAELEQVHKALAKR